MFKPPKSNRKGGAEQDSECAMVEDESGSVNRKSAMMMKSRSVADSGGGVRELRGTKKWKGWYRRRRANLRGFLVKIILNFNLFIFSYILVLL